MKKTLLKSLALTAMGSLFLAGSAMALPMLQVTATGTSDVVYIGDGLDAGATYIDNGTTYTMTDNDAASNAGIVSVSENNFGNFSFTLAAGSTKPANGSAEVPQMHLGGFAVSNSNNSTITVKFSETDFGPMANSLTGFISSMNGAGGIQSLKVYYDIGNALFATTTQIADINTINTDAIYGSIPNSNLFSLTMVATMELNNGDTGSFDNTVAPVPEPATMLLLGTGLAGIAGLRRKKAKKA